MLHVELTAPFYDVRSVRDRQKVKYYPNKTLEKRRGESIYQFVFVRMKY